MDMFLENGRPNRAAVPPPESVLDAIPDGLVVLSPERTVLSVNRAFNRLFELDEDALVGRNLLEVFRGEDLGEALATASADHVGGHGLVFELAMTAGLRCRHVRIKLSRLGATLDRGLLMIVEDLESSCNAAPPISRLAAYDPLTGVANRALLVQRLAHEIPAVTARGERLVLMWLNIDRFQSINDFFGRSGGDQLLHDVAKRLRRMLRGEDTVARVGGDEFVVMAAVSDEVAAGIAKRIADALASPFAFDPGASTSATITASIGIVACPQDGDGAEQLLLRAKIAMHRARERGERFHFFRAAFPGTLRVVRSAGTGTGTG